MEKKLIINYSEIDKEARQYVEYVGSKRTEGEYERILLQVEDASLLEKLHREMIAGLNSIMMMWSKIDEETSIDHDGNEGTEEVNARVITYLLPSNAGISVADTVQKEAEAYCVSYIVSRWFQVAGVDLAEEKAAESLVHLRAICNAMTRRVPPLRHQPPHISQHVGYTTGNDAGVFVRVTSENNTDVTINTD